MKKAWLLAMLLASLAAREGTAQELSVLFVDGDVLVRAGTSSWTALGTGDRLSPQAVVQLADGAYVELGQAGSRIVLSQPGAYALRDIVASSRALSAAGVGRALTSSLALLARGTGKTQGTVSGARAANTSEEDDSDWVSSSSQVYLDAGRSYLQSGRPAEAIEHLLLALDSATAEESAEVRYCLAAAYALNGNTRAALQYAAGLQPSRGDAWAADFIVLKARLLVDSNAFAQEVEWLTRDGNDLTRDAQRGGVYTFLLGLGHRGLGEGARARACFAKVAAESPDSDLGNAAAQLLGAP